MKVHYGPRFRALHWCSEQVLSAALADMDLTSAQGHIMGYITRQDIPPCSRDIEKAFHLSHATVSGTLNRMEKKGFIEFRPDESDRRCKRIYILPKGQQCHDRIVTIIESTERRIVQGFTESEQELFSAFLNRAIDNMGGIPCPLPIQKEEL